MDELKEADLSRMVNKLKNSFDNINMWEGFTYLDTIKEELVNIRKNYIYTIFKNAYRMARCNYINRNVLIELSNEYEEIVRKIYNSKYDLENVDTIKEMVIDMGELFKDSSYHNVIIADVKDLSFINTIQIRFTPLRGLVELIAYLHINNGVITGFEIISTDPSYRTDIETFDIENSTDEYLFSDSCGAFNKVKVRSGSDDVGYEIYI